jgi:transposase
MEKGPAEKSGINLERIAIYAGTAFAAGSFIVTTLSYVRPTDSAHPIHFQFLTRTVSFPLWGAIFGITAVAMLSFFLGLKGFPKANALPATPQVSHVPITGRASRMLAQDATSSVIQPAQLVATRNNQGLVLKMPEHYTVRIHRQDYSDTKALVVSVDNNRLEMALVADVQSLLRELGGRKGQPTTVLIDSRTLQSTPESGARAGYDGAKRRKGSKVHIAVDTLGHLLALKVTAADQGDRTQVAALAEEVQQVTGKSVELAYVDQGYTGQNTAEAAQEHGIRLEIVKHPMAKRGFILLPKRWVVERSFAWAARFRRLARDYERLPQTLKALHFIAFAMLMSAKLINHFNATP